MKSNIKSFFQSLIKQITFKDVILILLLLGLIISNIISCHKDNSQKTQFISSDSLETYISKKGDTLTGKNTYIQDIKDLKKSNEELYQQVKTLSKLKFQPIFVSNVEEKMKIDTIYTEKGDTASNQKTSEKILNWKSPANQYYSFNGSTRVKTDFSDFSTTITNFQVHSNLKVNLVEKDKQLKVVVNSDNPYVDVTNINSVTIDPRKSKVIKSYFPTKRWHIGPYVGVGLDKNMKVTPSVGISLSYGLINF